MKERQATQTPTASMPARNAACVQSVSIHVDNSLGKGLRGLLREVVSDASCNKSVRICTGKPLGVSRRVRVRRAVRIAFQGDRGHADQRRFSEPPFQGVVLRLTLGQAESPTIVVNDDGDVVRVVE